METRAILKSFFVVRKTVNIFVAGNERFVIGFQKKKNQKNPPHTQNKINKQKNTTSQTNIPVHIYLMEYISKKQFGTFGRRIFGEKIWYLGEMDTRLMVFFNDDNTLGRLFAVKIIL